VNLSPANPPLSLLTIAAALFLFCCLASEETEAAFRPELATRLKLSWEYDDNVLEERSGKLSGGAGALSLFSKIRLNTPKSLTLFDFQIGYKGHHRLSRTESLTAGDILVHRLTLESERRLSPNWSAGLSAELKQRNIYRKNKLNLLSEEGYLRGSWKLFARRNLKHLGILTLIYRYSFFDFETFHSFDFNSHSPRVKLSHPFADNLTGSLQYSLHHRRYSRFISVLGSQGSLIQQPERQRDNLHQLDFSLFFRRGALFNFTYSLQRNSSNNYGFSYWSNRFSMLLAEKLPYELFLNAYLFFELKRYSDKVDIPILVDIITEENNNNGAIIKLSHPLSPAVEAAVTFSLYRNESSIRDLNFHKSLLNFGLTYRL